MPHSHDLCVCAFFRSNWTASADSARRERAFRPKIFYSYFRANCFQCQGYFGPSSCPLWKRGRRILRQTGRKGGENPILHHRKKGAPKQQNRISVRATLFYVVERLKEACFNLEFQYSLSLSLQSNSNSPFCFTIYTLLSAFFMGQTVLPTEPLIRFCGSKGLAPAVNATRITDVSRGQYRRGGSWYSMIFLGGWRGLVTPTSVLSHVPVPHSLWELYTIAIQNCYNFPGKSHSMIFKYLICRLFCD